MRTRGKSEDGGRPDSEHHSPSKAGEIARGLTIEDKYCPDVEAHVGGGHTERKSRSRAGSLDCSISSDNSDSKHNKKKKRGRDNAFEGNEVPGDTGVQNEDFRLFESCFPKEFEPDFCTAVFEVGLKHSSPKVLMSLMPQFTNLHSEHLKSHLQKYRIHHERSKDEFLAFYNEFMRDDFLAWEDEKGWETRLSKKPNDGKLIALDTKLSLQVPLIDITNAANSIQNDLSPTLAVSPFNRSQTNPQSPSGQKKTRSLAGYKNIVSQASLLYSEWRMLFEESLSDTSKFGNSGNSSFAPPDSYQEFPKGPQGFGKGKRQNPNLSSKYQEDPANWNGNDQNNLSSISNDSHIHNSQIVNNPHYGGPNFNGDINNNMMYYVNNMSLPMLPLHSNPYGGYSHNYSTSSYPPLPPHQLHPNLNPNGININNLSNLNNINAHHLPPNDNFLPLNIPGARHYLPQLPGTAASRVSSQDGSDDNCSESSNASNASSNETLSNNNSNGIINGNAQNYFIKVQEQNRVSEVLNTSNKVLLRPHR